MTPARGLPVAVVGLALTAVVLLPSPLPPQARGATALVVLATSTASALLDRWRPAAALVVLLCLAAVCLAADGAVAVTAALLGGLALRVWCGLPELLDLAAADRRELRRDLLPELLGGAAAAGLVLAAAEARGGLPAGGVVVGVAATAVLVAAGLARVRSSPSG